MSSKKKKTSKKVSIDSTVAKKTHPVYTRFIKHSQGEWSFVTMQDGVETEVCRDIRLICLGKWKRWLNAQPVEAVNDDD